VLDERKLAVLRAVVQDYVATSEPVGSKALVERHALGVSPATIRNDMAALEDEGYIIQPHTSAGRIPTDSGYRLFVDQLSTIKPLSSAERRAIERVLAGAVDLDDVVLRTVRLLAQVTGQVAVMQYPSLSRSRIRHVELVVLDVSRVMIVVITDAGRIEQRIVDTRMTLDEQSVVDLRDRLNQAVTGRLLTDVPEVTAKVADTMETGARSVASAAISTMIEALIQEREERVVLAGTANLTAFDADFPQTIRPVLEALEEHVVLLRLLSEDISVDEVQVQIGHELPVESLSTTSLVSTAYGDAGAGRLGIIGPTRMDYPSTIGVVRAVAAYVGRVLEESS
jgi:heat-inducible transcriptional repressor